MNIIGVSKLWGDYMRVHNTQSSAQSNGYKIIAVDDEMGIVDSLASASQNPLYP